jgi:hypothetical protein
MSPWDWLALTLIALVVVAGVIVLVYWAFRAINRAMPSPGGAGDQASRSADRLIVLSQLWMAVGLIVFGAGIAVIFGVLFSDRDIDKVALSIGTAVIGTGAALLPAGASASASGRILDSLKKVGPEPPPPPPPGGDGTDGDVPPPGPGTGGATVPPPTDDSAGADDGDTPPPDMDFPAADPGAPPADVPEPQDATVPDPAAGQAPGADEPDEPPPAADPPKRRPRKAS